MKKPEAAPPVSDGGKALFCDDGWRKACPVLCEYLVDVAYDDGSPREQGTLTIKEQDGGVCVALNDREGSRSLYRTGQSVTEALKALEKALNAPAADWRAWNVGKKKKA